MFTINTRQAASLSCKIDFRASAVANIDFFAGDLETIPFHISLRRDEECAVLNRRSGQVWHREWHYAFDPGKCLVDLEVVFRAGQVVVRLDGQKLARFGWLPRLAPSTRVKFRKGYSRLNKIEAVEISGDFDPHSLVIETRGVERHESTATGLNDALELVFDEKTLGYSVGADESPALPTIRVSSLDEDLPLILRVLPYAIRANRANGQMRRLVAVLPGRIWDDAGESVKLVLHGGAGAPFLETELTRAQFVARINALAEKRALASNDFATLQAIEHVRHGALWSRLNSSARAELRKAATGFNLTEYLFSDAPDFADIEKEEAPLVTETESDADLMVERFLAALRTDPAADALAVLEGILRDIDPEPKQKSQGLLRLGEWFCAHGGMETLVALWRREGLPKVRPSTKGDAWGISVRLPFLFAQGDFDAVRQGLERLSAPNLKGWVVTQGLGWIATVLAGQQSVALKKRPSPAQSRALVGAFAQVLRAMAANYWSHNACLRLIRGVVALLAAQDLFPRDMKDSLSRDILRCYALMPAFWREFERMSAAGAAVESERAGHLHQAFLQLEDAMARREPVSKPELSELLKPFSKARCYDFHRFARDLIGPAGHDLADGDLPEAQGCRDLGMDPDEAMLRFAGAPSARQPDAPMSEEFRKHLRQGIEKAYTRVDAGPFTLVQQTLHDHLTRLLQRPDQAALDYVVHLIPITAEVKGGCLGLSMALMLIERFLGTDRWAEAKTLTEAVLAFAEGVEDPELSWVIANAPGPVVRFAQLEAAHKGHPQVMRLEEALSPLFTRRVELALDDRTADIRAASNPIHDTVVCLYTCQPNLDTRVQRIRETWMRKLEEMGVAVLVFVGNGDGRRQGDVVYLDAPDDYEGLPDKTLAMVRWVFEHTNFSYLYKIDDDCVLAVEDFFRALTHQKFNYYGRPLVRRRGEVNRVWHMAKATSARGRLELDKSPEPSAYADGGSGYALSRVAMQALLAASESEVGQELRLVSFLEDKLVGDLLKLRGFWTDGEDYRTCVMRYTHKGGAQLAAWENGFLPFKESGIKIAHLDGVEGMDAVTRGCAQNWPRPYKLWPTYRNAQLGWTSNTLDLISPPEKLARLNAAEFAVIVCLRNENFVIRQFLDHYRKLGVKAFLCVDNRSTDGTFQYLAEQEDVALFAADTPYGHSTYGVAWQQTLLANLRAGRWSLVADADEFLFWNPSLDGSLPDLVRGDAFAGANAARIFMLDMYPKGPLSEADFRGASPFEQAAYVDAEPFLAPFEGRGPFADAPLWTSALRHRLIPSARSDLFVAQKLALLRYEPWMRLTAGLHFVAHTRLAERDLMFAHFKYNAAFHDKAQAEVARAQHFNNAEEYRKYLALTAEGRDVVYDPDVSQRWDESAFVRQIMSGQKPVVRSRN